MIFRSELMKKYKIKLFIIICTLSLFLLTSCEYLDKSNTMVQGASTINTDFSSLLEATAFEVPNLNYSEFDNYNRIYNLDYGFQQFTKNYDVENKLLVIKSFDLGEEVVSVLKNSDDFNDDLKNHPPIYTSEDLVIIDSIEPINGKAYTISYYSHDNETNEFITNITVANRLFVISDSKVFEIGFINSDTEFYDMVDEIVHGDLNHILTLCRLEQN